ncbi:MAG: NAD-dependent protein deacylase [Candidatus Helarchaeota archaeon]|nr:NAD-dependent protein deacylase [Candidatus Helarchaeota archaeon]
MVLTGAGISTESGLPDYRGVWQLKDKSKLYKSLSVNWKKVEPNAGHLALVKLQELKILKFLISQNIDNLHLKSGIHKDIIAELHGNMTLVRCPKCGKKIEQTWDRPSRCECGGLFESSIVKFGDKLPKDELDTSFEHAELADVFMVVGSSLVTKPAGNIPRLAKMKGAKLIIINRGVTTLENFADLRFNEDCSETLSALVKKIIEIKNEQH